MVASVWGTEFIQFRAVMAVLPRTILNNRMNCTMQDDLKEKDELILLFKIFLGKMASVARN